MDENDPDDLGVLDAFGASWELFPNRLIDLEGCRIEAQGTQSVDQVGMVSLGLFLLSFRQRRSHVVLGVEEDRLAIDPAVSSPDFQTHLLRLFDINWTMVRHIIDR